MKKIVAYKTADGKIHEGQRDASRYAEAAYSDALSRVVHEILAMDGKWSNMYDLVNQMTKDGTLANLIRLQRDLGLEEEDE